MLSLHEIYAKSDWSSISAEYEYRTPANFILARRQSSACVTDFLRSECLQEAAVTTQVLLYIQWAYVEEEQKCSNEDVREEM